MITLFACGEDEDPVSEFLAAVSLNISSTSVAEGGDDVIITITLDKENISGSSISIPLSIGGSATNGDDYESIPQTLQIPANAQSATLSIVVIDDSEVEGPEEITIRLNTAGLPDNISAGSQNTVTLTINDNDQTANTLSVTIEGMTSAAESDMGTGFKVILDQTNETGSDISISYDISGTATAGSDYTNPGSSATIASQERELMINIPFSDDNEVEGAETIIITLSSNNLPADVVLGSPNSLTITISDDDGNSETCDNDNSIDQNFFQCGETPTESNTYSETISGNERTVVTNGIPTHDFRNQIPKVVEELNSETKTFTMDVTPEIASSVTNIADDGVPVWKFGVAKNGVPIDPAPAQPFIFENTETGEFNFDWFFEPNWNMSAVGLDCALAHVQPDGTYHYHGDMGVYADQLLDGLGSGTTTPTEPVQIGWAADGFPILYKFGPDAAGSIKELLPSYSVKTGDRPGDGVTEPCGEFNGKYTNDFEFVSGMGDLDECNGVDREITIGGETFSYFYVITKDFPVISRCITGTPDGSFRLGGG